MLDASSETYTSVSDPDTSVWPATGARMDKDTPPAERRRAPAAISTISPRRWSVRMDTVCVYWTHYRAVAKL